MLERSPVSAGRRTLVFSLPADHHPASVVGTFNEWTPGVTLLRPAADGWISAVVEVDAAADQCFRYLGADGWWFDELDADLIDTRGSHVLGVAEIAEVEATETIVADQVEETEPADDPEPAAHRPARPEPAPRGLLSPAAWAARKERRLRGKRAKRMRGDDAAS